MILLRTFWGIIFSFTTHILPAQQSHIAQIAPNAKVIAQTPLKTKKIIQKTLPNTSPNAVKWMSVQMLQYHKYLLFQAKWHYEQALQDLNSLRPPNYGNDIKEIAKKLEGLNMYHDYAGESTEENSEENTCVNGWCQVMGRLNFSPFDTLLQEQITLKPKTLAKEQKKKKGNLYQLKAKYIHVNQILVQYETLGFLPIDLDLTQRGDFSIQYYRKNRGGYESYAPQHISIVDTIVKKANNDFELRDWHEGVEGEPFIYRTGTNKKSSYNNNFTFENVYFGFQESLGVERKLSGKNPNVSQGYAYFGKETERAKNLLKILNFWRGQVFFLETVGKFYGK